MKWNCRNFYKTEEERRIKKEKSRMYSEKTQMGEVLTYIFLWDNVRKSPIGWLIEETPDKERLIPQKEMPVFFMDENNTYTSSGGRKFKIIKIPAGIGSSKAGIEKKG